MFFFFSLNAFGPLLGQVANAYSLVGEGDLLFFDVAFGGGKMRE